MSTIHTGSKFPPRYGSMDDWQKAKAMVDDVERNAFARGVWFGVAVALLLVLIAVGATADEVSSVRDSDHEWYCETQTGVEISGHTRQDKAFQSCMNMALQDGATYIVRGGTYRVSASLDLPPVVEPPPIEPPPTEPPVEPPPEPPADDLPMVTFGPVTSITQYPNTISALAQDQFRWQLTFTLTQTSGIQGLASRDESGTSAPGHLSVWVDNGSLTLRHQDGGLGTDGIQFQLTAQTAILPGVQYVATVSVEKGVGTGLWLNGVMESSDTSAYGLSGNDLPLTLAGLCTRCDDAAVPAVGPDRPLDGEVSLAIYNDPLPMPDGTAMLNWTNPTEDEDGQALPAGIPDRISIYAVPGSGNATVSKSLVAHLDGESISYEVTGLPAGEACFVATAWNVSVQSADSNTVCKPVP